MKGFAERGVSAGCNDKFCWLNHAFGKQGVIKISVCLACPCERFGCLKETQTGSECVQP